MCSENSLLLGLVVPCNSTGIRCNGSKQGQGHLNQSHDLFYYGKLKKLLYNQVKKGNIMKTQPWKDRLDSYVKKNFFF